MLRKVLLFAITPGLALFSVAQQPQPQVKLNVLNVCSPSPQEQQEIASALERVPRQPSFSKDFEIDRGRSILDETPDFLQPGQNAQMSSDSGTADWVRIRREFPGQAFFSTVQYSFSRDPRNMVETLVFHVRDPKDLSQIAIEDSASAVTTAAAMLIAETPAGRIKLERFGQTSIVLARCAASEDHPAPDQRVYEPLFQKATAIVASYRSILGARKAVPEELSRIRVSGVGKTRLPSKPAAQEAAPQNKSQ
ncbi:MAG: hypothetical protein WB952_07185 [Terriglobales bacterium]